LTKTEALALAFVEFKQNSFTSNKLTTYLCSFLAEPFRPSKIAIIEGLLQDALDGNLVEIALGPRDGDGDRISLDGLAYVGEVDLPSEKFKRRNDIDDEKSMETNANVGPVFKQLLELLPSGERERNLSRTS
jgi:hypothetical protein